MTPGPERLPELRVEVDFDPRIHYALHHGDVPVVKEVRLSNERAEDLHDVVLRIELGDGLAIPFERRFDLLRTGTTHRLTAPELRLDPQVLRAQEEREGVDLRVTATVGEGEGRRVLADLRLPAEVFAFREWTGLRSLPALLAAFVLPNHAAIAGLLARTATRLGQATGRPDLTGYQTRDPNRARAMVEAVYAALRDCEIRYATPPASFEDAGQKVRLPDDVLRDRLGTCLDLVLVAAAVIEQAGLHPLLVLIEGHAFVGAWLEASTFPECVVTDAQRLRKRVDLGDVVVFEATGMSVGGMEAFEAAEAAARRHLDDDERFRCAIDVVQARVQRIRPLPTRSGEVSEPVGDVGPVVAEESPGLVEPESPPESPVGVIPPAERPIVPEKRPSDPAAARLEAWQRRLLDLSFRNRLLAFRDSKRALPLLSNDAGAVEDALAAGAAFVCVARPELERPAEPEGHVDLEQQIARDELGQRRLVTSLTRNELERRMLEVFRNYRTAIEETGANSLFLALGMLRYREAPASRVEREAPLLLLPLDLERRSVREGFRVRLADDEAQVNTTLLEKLRVDWGISVPAAEIAEDEHGIDVGAVLNAFRRAVVDVEGFEVLEKSWIGIFSFQKFLMWRDLQARADDLLKNPVVAHLVARSGGAYEGEAEYPDPAELDDSYAIADTWCPLDADSSQLAAVYASAEGRSFVLEGPPGTGKSQTITNLIAQNLALGRRVLFVSEKRAALEVVRGRLDRIGLGAFCLELHSHRASKRAVLDQLEEPFTAAATEEPRDWERLARELEEERDALNEYVRAIHRARPIGESVFRVTSELIGLAGAPRVAFDLGDPEAFDRDAIGVRRPAVGRLSTAARQVCPVGAHAFRHVRRTDWRATLPDDLDAALRRAEAACAAFAGALRGVAARLGVPEDALDRERVQALLELGALLEATPPLPEALLGEGSWSKVRGAALAAIEAGRARDELRAHVRRTFDAAVLGLDLERLRGATERAARSMWPLSWWRGRAVRRELAPVLAPGRSAGALPEIVEHLGQAIELRAMQEKLSAPDHDGARLLGVLWRGGDPARAAWDELTAAVELASRLRSTLLRLVDGFADEVRVGVQERVLALVAAADEQLAEGAPARVELAELAATSADFRAARGALEELLDLDPEAWNASGAWLPAVAQRLTAYREGHRRLLRDWLFWREARGSALELGLEALVDAVESGRVAPDACSQAFERSWREAWWNATHDREPVLRAFVGVDHERRIARFRELDRRSLELARRVVAARLRARVPRFDTDASEVSELGVLQRELRKKRRHLPVRRLFERMPNLLARLKPCVLMSPLSVAQYLDPATPPFDLVVFDEASQITVWDAVGALARGAACVVVGDSRQLPPTSFFQRTEDEEVPDELDAEELESVLDECVAAGFRSLRLEWHYRSRHESLIAFSNYHYYDNRLHTFPSPVDDPQDLGVSLVPVPDGVYDRSKSRTNRKEAEAVVADLVARLREHGDRRSHGVVTFSMAQQALVEDLLDKARSEDPELERFFSDGDEPVFVKNLENVQGDERDVILFSVCYGPDPVGRVAMQFGPLNLQGGERRLNVAVTRARRQVVVYATLTPDRIDLSRTDAVGVAHLKTFLDYAARGPRALGEAVALRGDAAYESPFEREVGEALRRRGHDVVRQVGCSGYRIDLAIRDPERPGRFLLGIECDGAFYHSARTARDRDRIRQAVLEGLGWQLCRVWSTDWWRSPEHELDRLDEAIERARRQRPGESVAEPRPAVRERFAALVAEPPAPPPPPPAPTAARAYVAALVESLGESADLHASGALVELERVVRKVLEVEAPIEVGLFHRRVAAFWSARVTARVRERIDSVLAALPLELQPVVRDGFLWRADQDPGAWRGYRVAGASPETERNADELPPEEVAEAAREVLGAQIALPRSELVREAARCFGFKSTGSRVQRAMLCGIDALIARGGATVDGDTLVARDP